MGGDLDGDGQEDGVDAGFPTIQWAMPLSGDFFGKGVSKVALFGHWGAETADFDAGKNGRFDTWSTGMMWVMPLSSMFSWKGSVWMGANLDAYTGGIGQGVNARSGASIDSKGGWSQLGIKLCKGLELNLGGGMDDPDDADLAVGARSLNRHVGTNLIYAFGNGVSVGLEYQRLQTEYLQQGRFSAHRLHSSLIYKF
jgi:hypothetical protein